MTVAACRSSSSSTTATPASALRPLPARRRWESSLSDVLSERGRSREEMLAAKYESIYVKKDFTPVNVAFPHSAYESKRWTGAPSEEDGSAASRRHERHNDDGGGSGTRSNNKNDDEDDVEDAALRRAMEQQRADDMARRRREFAERRKRLARGAPPEPYSMRVALLGPPNAGKSSLLNTMVAAHVSAESKRSGTTVDWVKGVARVHDTQMQLLDTPGIFLPDNQLHRRQQQQHQQQAGRGTTARLDRYRTLRLAAWDSIFSANVVLVTLPVGLGFLEPRRKALLKEIAGRCRAREIPIVLALTKMDLLHHERHLVLYRHLRADIDTLRIPFAETAETSALLCKGVVELKDTLASFAAPGPWEFSKSDVTDLNLADRVSEIVREAAFEHLPHAVPHLMTHKVVGWTVGEDKLGNKITQVIVEVFFDRPSFMHTFLQRQMQIAQTARERCKVALKQNVWFHFQSFVAPTGKNRV